MATGIVFPSSSSRELIVKSPAITNIVITDLLEHSYTLDVGTRKMTIKCRNAATIKLAFNIGESGTNYITVPMGCILSEENFDLPITLYFQLNQNDVVEILTWQKL